MHDRPSRNGLGDFLLLRELERIFHNCGNFLQKLIWIHHLCFALMVIDPIADYRAIDPTSIGTITIVRPPSPTNGYSVPSQPELVLRAECAGLKLSDRSPGYDRTAPGTVDRTVWRCLVGDNEETRTIESGMWCRIEWRGSALEGKVDVREPKDYEARRLYINTGENCLIDWSEFQT